jgi:type IV secretion system protein VirB11
MVRHIALEQGQDFSKSCPSLSTSIPEYGFRIQAFGYASSPYGISISIRCGAARTFPIEGYFSGDDAKFMINAVKNDQTILVCGGTRSGKTTFLNSLIPSIPMDTRLGVVEDTQELNIPHPNQFRLLLSKTATDAGRMTWEDAINICMRMRPDRLMVGELDTRNTGSFLRIINTGHGGSMSSLHANSPKDAIRALVQNAMMDGVLNNADVVRDYAISGIQLIVFIERAKGRYKAHMELAEDLR